GIDGNGALVTANISSIYDINGTGHAYGFVKNGARAVPGDSGSPIVCEADDKIFAQGTHSVVYDDNSGLTE
uniref:Uncharacterized protein n=1 Tax=Romanomermis culicivorax TaxID=13658 RepID=A0A915HQW9_ROMCU